MYQNIEQQLSVEIANAPGEIARISDLLSSNGVNANAMSVADGVYRGYFRFLTDKVEEAKSVLISNGLDVECERVISVKLDDQKGQVAKITSALARANINIDIAINETGILGGEIERDQGAVVWRDGKG